LHRDEVLQRLSVNPKIGLDLEQAKRRLATNGPNAVTPPRDNVFLKWLGYVFGGFGTILFIAAILCFIAW
jgi:sodium/potassium-transporting ATPase subunit alpha